MSIVAYLAGGLLFAYLMYKGIWSRIDSGYAQKERADSEAAEQKADMIATEDEAIARKAREDAEKADTGINSW